MAAPGKISDIVLMNGSELSAAIKAKRVSSAEVMIAYLDHIAQFNPKVNAIVSLRDRDACMKDARDKDAELARGNYQGWMHGFPHAVKDLAAAKGIRLTQGSPLFKDFIAPNDAIHVERMKRAGAIIIAKTNTPEFGLGSQTYNPVFGTTLNPYDVTKTPGGSSGGACASLAFAHGTGCRRQRLRRFAAESRRLLQRVRSALLMGPRSRRRSGCVQSDIRRGGSAGANRD
jgi:amidase